MAPHLSNPVFTARLPRTARLTVGDGLSPPDARAAALALPVRAAERRALLPSCLVMLCQQRLR